MPHNSRPSRTCRGLSREGRPYKCMLSKRHEGTAGSLALREQLQHVYWIGGGSCAGKSTIARRIAAQHGLRVYATDDVMANHARRSTPEDSPLLHKFMAMDMDERWVNRPPKTLLETFHWFQGEGFNMIIEDLLCLPREPGVIPGIIVEGFRLLPRLVKPLLSVPAHAVWLLPTPAFRQTVVESRGGSAWGFLAKTTDPERALRNLLERDQMFTDILREETRHLEVPAIEVDATMTEDDLAKRVTEVFGL
jgi:2-phosphoglycerate kinase